jgi:hypothetical protein
VLGLGGISGEEVVVKVSYVPGKVAALMEAEPVRTAVVSRPSRSTISAREYWNSRGAGESQYTKIPSVIRLYLKTNGGGVSA